MAGNIAVINDRISSAVVVDENEKWNWNATQNENELKTETLRFILKIFDFNLTTFAFFSFVGVVNFVSFSQSLSL